METLFYLKGLIIGISIAAPVGPIGIICMRRTLTQGRMIGFISGLGAATADAIYGLIAGFGLAAISNFLIGQQFWIQLAGGLFLCYLGIKTVTSKALHTPIDTQRKNRIGAFLSVFILTLTNPMTILSFIAIFAGLGISSPESNTGSALMLVFGVFSGSTLWWVFLSSVVGLLKHRLNTKTVTMINRLSGIMILLFGALALYSLLL
jgi:threonine/homoserine/homoserine lactone efflux protein